LATGCGPAGVVLVGVRDVVVVRRVVVGDVVVRCVVVRDGDVVVVGSVVRVAPAPASAAGREPPRWLNPTAARPSRTTATNTIATMGPRDGRFGGGPGQKLVGGGITGATTGGRDQFIGGGVIGGR
jgi:hypothetical protein